MFRTSYQPCHPEFTKNRVDRHRHRKRQGKEKSGSGRVNDNLDLSNSNHSKKEDLTRPIVELEKGVGHQLISIDNNQKVREELDQPAELSELIQWKVTFDDTPIFVNPDLKVDKYDIVQDIKD